MYLKEIAYNIVNFFTLSIFLYEQNRSKNYYTYLYLREL